jgi:GH43 family beta-xylosidase
VISTPTLSWETQGAAVNEGPEPLQRGGRTFLTCSASACDTPDYKLGQLELTGSDPLSALSWTKNPTPVFQRDDAAGVHGPGHNGFFTSPDGTENWIVHHANDSTSGKCGNGRTPRAQKFTWNADGTPHIGTPVAYSLVNVATGKVLDVSGCGTADVRQWTWLADDCRKWQLTPTN